ncbi:MAG: hypothetical protein C4526_09550 [Nitrospiraceae bacterium]|nr:MAG: hypothetical protein C4526_09550 [Nitrospiraceae bacterium]
MTDLELEEGIYVKRSRAALGVQATFRECVLETLWFPCGVANGYVELFPVTDDLKRVLRIKEKVPLELFQKEYSVRENSREAYLRLKETVF